MPHLRSTNLICHLTSAIVALLASVQQAVGQPEVAKAVVGAAASHKSIENLRRAKFPFVGSLLDSREFHTPLTREDASRALEILWGHLRKQRELERRKEFDDKQLSFGELNMRFEYQVFGEAPPGGRSLFISMHGGGEMEAEVNDKQWRNQIRLYQPTEGVYVAPRAPTNSWNLWHQGHIDDFFSTLIEDFVLFENVNPNRVYLMGYSAGGDGVYQVAPRMADRLAAAAMMAGHPNEAEPLGLRNIGFAIHVGELDTAFNRNEVAKQWNERLDQMREKDPDGYVHTLKLHKGKGHWMDREDAEAVAWLASFQRNPLPRRIVWKQDDVTHERFYWLAVPTGAAKAGALVTGSIRGQQINIESPDVTELIVRLRDDLVDMDQDITIRFNRKVVFRGQVYRTIAMILGSLEEVADPTCAFAAEVHIKSE